MFMKRGHFLSVCCFKITIQLHRSYCIYVLLCSGCPCCFMICVKCRCHTLGNSMPTHSCDVSCLPCLPQCELFNPIPAGWPHDAKHLKWFANKCMRSGEQIPPKKLASVIIDL